jgi:hypothetical protein
MKARIVVRLRPGILDPQGTTIRRALEGLGFPEVRDMRVGKLIDLTLDETDAARGPPATRRDVPEAPRQPGGRGLHLRGGGRRRRSARELTSSSCAALSRVVVFVRAVRSEV